MTAPRIAVLTTSFPRFIGDEASLFLGRLIDALSEAGSSGIVVAPYDREEQRKEERGAFTIIRQKYGVFSRGQLAFGQGILPNLRKNLLLALQVPGLLLQLFLGAFQQRKSWEVIHGHWIVTAIPATFLHLLTRKPFVVTVRGEDIKLLRTPLRHLLLPFLKQAAHLTTVSDDFRREVLEICPQFQQKISTVPNGITRFEISEEQAASLKKKLCISDHGNVLSYVGRVVALKRPEVLLQLLSKVREQVDCTLVLAGRITEKYREELLTEAEQLGVRNHVIIPGALTPDEIGTLYSLSKIYLSGSSHEGRSNAVLEALAAGIPVCASDIPGHRELIKDNENGMLFTTEALSATAERLLAVLQDSARYEALSGEAKRSVSHLSWQSCAEQYQQHFTQVLRA